MTKRVIHFFRKYIGLNQKGRTIFTKMLTGILLLVVVVQDQVDVAVKNMRPSALVAKLAPTLGSDSGATADDLKGVIHVTGTEEGITRIKKFIAMFDVKPMTLVIKWKGDNEVEKYSYEGSVSLRNGVTFTFSDSFSRAKVRIGSSLTLDESSKEAIGLRTDVQLDLDDATFTQTFQSKSEAKITARIPDMKPVNERAKQVIEKIDPRELPKFTFTISIQWPKKN